MALAVSARTSRVQLSVYLANTCRRSELGWDTASRYLTLAGTPVSCYCQTSEAAEFKCWGTEKCTL